MHPERQCFIRYVCLFFGLFIYLVGCASMRKDSIKDPYRIVESAELNDIFHVPTGIRITKGQLLELLAGRNVIYIGETHDNMQAHRVQLEIIKGLAELYPGELAAGMEMFRQPSQVVLDRWSRGDLTEREFLRESKWYSVWKMDYDYYKPILDFIREQHLPLLALDAPEELTKEVSGQGLQGISEEERKKLPKMDLSDKYHRRFIKAFYKGHPSLNESFDRFYEVHVLREETMAEVIANFLMSENGKGKKLVVLAGGNHVRYGLGIPRRVFRRLPGNYAIVLPWEISMPEDKKERLMDVKLPNIPLSHADFYWMVNYEDLKKERVRLGVIVEEATDNVRVTRVFDGSSAAKAGIKEGDILISMDGEELHDTFDLIYLIGQKRVGDKGKLLIERGEEQIELEALFGADSHP
jgi:uncharacterized iron-regulated protein